MADAAAWLVPLCTAAGTAAGVALEKFLAYRRGQYRDSVADYQKITDRLQAQVDQQQKVINRMAALYAHCQADSAEQYALLMTQNGLLNRWRAMLVKAGLDVEEVPDLPPRPRPPGEAEFLQRQTQQNTDLLKGGQP